MASPTSPSATETPEGAATVDATPSTTIDPSVPSSPKFTEQSGISSTPTNPTSGAAKNPTPEPESSRPAEARKRGHEESACGEGQHGQAEDSNEPKRLRPNPSYLNVNPSEFIPPSIKRGLPHVVDRVFDNPTMHLWGHTLGGLGEMAVVWVKDGRDRDQPPSADADTFHEFWNMVNDLAIDECLDKEYSNLLKKAMRKK